MKRYVQNNETKSGCIKDLSKHDTSNRTRDRFQVNLRNLQTINQKYYGFNEIGVIGF